ncbi:carbohydrate ABC transporter permease [Dictyobacter formicarum]|uniref:Sugar ABC transporter permease n=1 Tax=Dictyobacter formicarum TaxID=2778368 RepID=A0ABQ3VPA7_9CHLR|nr:carbohydrate ABC transporter permease [Dictyobacter formicarum]GHO88077.1 sugar ABC transporter permease [Dictyobacter formicarum]
MKQAPLPTSHVGSLKRTLSHWPQWVILLIVTAAALIFVIPLWWTIVWGSWHTDTIFSFPPRFLPGPYMLDNLKKLEAQISVWRAFLNSVIVTGVSLAGALFFCSLAGFAFAKYRFRFKNALFYILLATMAVPGQITAIPLFVIMLKLGWVNTYQGIIIPGLVPAFGVFLMRTSIQQAIPDEILESARMDGANEVRIFFQIAFPNLLPYIAALSVFLFAGSWGSLYWPIIMLRSSDMFTLPVSLASIIGSYSQPYDELMVGSLLSVIPPLLLLLFLQRFFVKSLVAASFR